jgi:hypothetical protein
VAVAVGLLACSGAGFAYALGLQRPFLRAVPDAARGQAFTLLSTGLMTLQGLGPVVAGAAAELAAPAVVIAAAGLATMVVAVTVVRVRPVTEATG